MSTEGIDFKPVIALLRARRARLDAAIATLESESEISGGGIDPSMIDTAEPRSEQRTEPSEIRSDTFFGLSIPDAIRKCFKILKRPLSLSEVTTSLKAGGLLTTAQNLMATVSATLQRMKRTEGDVVSLGNGQWGLTEWYPGLRKDKIEATAKPKKKKRHAPKAKAEPKLKEPTPKGASHGPTPEQIEQIKKLNAAGKTPGEIAKEVGLHHFSVMAVLKTPKAA